MSSRKTMKRITTKNKKKPIFDNSHLETKEETKEEPETSETKEETKEEPETSETKEEPVMSEKLKPNDKYLCTKCNMVLLYKNYDRHTKTQTHIKKLI
jgi:hypothetical protein